MKQKTFQELLDISREEGILPLKDVSAVVKDLMNSTEDFMGSDFTESDYSQSPEKKMRDLARLVKDETLTILANSNDFHNLAVDYARLNIYDCAVWILERGLTTSPYSSDLLADMILYGIESGQRPVCEKAHANLMRLEKDAWGWRAYSFTISYYLDKARRLPKGKSREALKEKTFALVEEFISFGKSHPEDAADRAFSCKAKVISEFGGKETKEDVLRAGCEVINPAPQCALHLADIVFNRGKYDETLALLRQCILAVQRPQPDINCAYTYLLCAMAKTSKLIAETPDGDYSNKEFEIQTIYKDFHTALAAQDIAPVYESAAQRTIKVLEVQTGFQDTTPMSDAEQFI